LEAQRLGLRAARILLHVRRVCMPPRRYESTSPLRCSISVHRRRLSLSDRTCVQKPDVRRGTRSPLPTPLSQSLLHYSRSSCSPLHPAPSLSCHPAMDPLHSASPLFPRALTFPAPCSRSSACTHAVACASLASNHTLPHKHVRERERAHQFDAQM